MCGKRSMYMRVLFFAFGPYSGVRKNITLDTALRIRKKLKEGAHDLKIVVLPVEWTTVEKIITSELTVFNPDIVIASGHAKGYSALTIETRYFNRTKNDYDVQGELRGHQYIKLDGKRYYDTNVAIKKAVKHLAKQHIPIALHKGESGMGYMCNFVAYLVAYHIHLLKAQKRTGFIFMHIPPQKHIHRSVEMFVRHLV